MALRSIAGTRLSRAQYLDHWRQELDLLLAAAATDLSAAVPSCPGWTVADVLHHLRNVFQHKTVVLELGAFPEEELWRVIADQVPADLLDDVAWWSDELQRQLSHHGYEDHTCTFMAEDQSIAFWYRRMALEVLVHRVDVERAIGVVSPMPAALSIDGIDELCWFMSSEAFEHAQQGWAGQSVALESAPWCWRLTFTPRSVLAEAAHGADARISGEPGEVLLKLSGRTAEVHCGGDRGALDLLEAYAVFE